MGLGAAMGSMGRAWMGAETVGAGAGAAAGTGEEKLGVGDPLGMLVDTFDAPATFSCVRP